MLAQVGRAEDFDVLEGDFSSAMLYYLRTLGGWETQLHIENFDLWRFEELPNPNTGSTLSLRLLARLP